MIIIHDGELNPDWNLNDAIILHTYDDFKQEILLFIEGIAEDILAIEKGQKSQESQEESDDDDEYSDNFTPKNNSGNILVLKTLGPTDDKKVLFEFQQDKQLPEFFETENISQFADKVINYWDTYFYDNLEIDDNTCVIYADIKIIVIIQDENVKEFVELFVSHFEKQEYYETCSNLKKYYQAWIKYVKNDKQGLPPLEENIEEDLEDDDKA
jgi:hypothetical protein